MATNIRREMMLTDLRQRIRAVKQAPDGTIDLLTEERQGGAAEDRAAVASVLLWRRLRLPRWSH